MVFLMSCEMLTGCSSFQIVSLTTIALTGKGIGDHALSMVSGQDCTFFNLVQGEQICYSDNSSEIVLLTNAQGIDDEIKITGDVSAVRNQWLVIGSFADRGRAEAQLRTVDHYHAQVIAAETDSMRHYRVIVGPVSESDVSQITSQLIKAGISNPWLITL